MNEPFLAADIALDVSLTEMLVQAGEYFIYSGCRYPCVISTIEIQAPFTSGGYNSSQGASIAVRKCDLRGAYPGVGAVVTARDTNFQVIKVSDDGPGLTLTAATTTV